MSQPTNDENPNAQPVPQDAQAQQPASPEPAPQAPAGSPTTPAQAARAEEVPAQPAAAQPAAQQPAAPQPTRQEQPTQVLPPLVPPAPQPPTQQVQQQPAPQAASEPQQPRYGAYAPQPTQQQGVQHPPQPQYGQAAQQQGQYGQQPQQAGPYGQPTQPGHDPYAGAAFGLPPQPPSSSTNPTKTTTRSRTWMPVAVAAIVAAVLAAGGTAVAVNALDDNTTPSSIASIGQQSSGDETVPVSGSTSRNPDWEAVTSTVSKSVVSISVTLSNGEAEGSGVILDKDGNVLTNNHVVSGAQNDTVQVTLADGRIFSAKIVGTDSSTDLAVVKLEKAPSDLSPATLGDSSKVTTGEAVMAVGNPLGLANTATTGIVSALNRPVSTSSSDSSGGGSSDAVVTNAIQIDAAINPGNSGGPLFNAQGQVIGITSSIATLSQNSVGGDSESGSIGLGFAIPVNLAKNISSQLIKNGTAEHAFLGVTLTDATATADGVTRQGAKVNDVTSGSPADKAGIKSGDVIVAIDGVASPGAESLTGFVRAHAAGDVVKLTIVRDGKSMDVDVTLAVKQETSSPSSSGDQNGQSGQGGQDGQQGGSGQDGSGSNDNPFGDFFGGQG